MATYERTFPGNYTAFRKEFHNQIIHSSVSTQYEGGQSLLVSDREVSLQVYERFSIVGGNRVSLSVMIADLEDHIHLTAITTGGSQAMLFKLNTLGEDAFLAVCEQIVENYIAT